MSKPKQPKATGRKLKQRAYKSFHLSKRLKHPAPKLPGVIALTKQTLAHVWKYKLGLLGILGIFAVVQLIFVQGVMGGNVTEFTESLNMFDDEMTGAFMGVALLTYITSTTGQATTEIGGLYQLIFVLLFSLVLIWFLRQTMAGTKVGLRDSFYKSMYPLIPFLLVLLVIALQLIPMTIGAWLFQILLATGIAVSLVEQLFWALIAGLFALLSVYMLCSSVFAAYIVTLPDMTPMRALRSARGLVLHRRLAVAWRILGLLLLLTLSGAAILVPVIFVAPAIATWVFYILSVLGLGLVHAYMYGLYRELLNDA